MILVVSHPADDHAVGVLRLLHRAGHPWVQFDTGQFPVNSSLTQRFGDGCPQFEIVMDGSRNDLSGCRVGWWRRPLPFSLHAEMSPDVASFTYTECHEAVAGLWAALALIWVNPPGLDEIAHHKPYQLKVAAQAGLRIPRTVITNDPDVARQFIDDLGPGRTIYKTFVASEEHWRETRAIRSEELGLLDRVRLAPVIFQEYVAADADVRVTVVGDRMFAAAITPAPGGYQLDYRMDLAGARFEPVDLPAETSKKIGALMRRLGLIYGAVDLRRIPGGEYVFLEVNPAGEWHFVEERTGQPITEAMADLLMGLDGRDT